MAERPWQTGAGQAARWDGYFLPGTHTLRNKLGIEDAAELARVEADITGARGLLLYNQFDLVPQTYDADHVRAIHHHLFQDVYEWAGELRTVGMSKVKGEAFAPPDAIGEFIGQAVGYLQDYPLRDLPLRGDDGPTVAKVLEASYVTLNYAHPFREGNGRTQRLFIEHVAATGGCSLDWSWATWRDPERDMTFNDVASHEGMTTGDPSLALEMFENITTHAPSG